jgi:hypothetical protein
MSRAERRALVERESPALPVSQQCRLLAISRSSIYRKPAEVDSYGLGVNQHGRWRCRQMRNWRSANPKRRLRRSAGLKAVEKIGGAPLAAELYRLKGQN